MKKILFVSNTASLTGAPYVLLLLLKWLKAKNKSLQLDIVFLEGGDLENEFTAVTNNSYSYSDVIERKAFIPKVTSFLYRRITRKGSRKDAFINKIASKDYDVIYANTIASVSLATAIKKRSKNRPSLIAHIHELNTTIKEYLPQFEIHIPLIDTFISVSKLVMNNLNTNWHIDPLKNHLVYAFSDKKVVKNKKASTINETFEVGASGLVSLRKGFDLFIQVANYINKQYPELKIRFTWVGEVSYLQRLSIDADLEKAKLKEVVFFVGEQKEPELFFQNFDVFLMTSREDPFPLVCIEVGKSGIPIICFEKATGTAEVFSNGGGFVVPYLDCITMANNVIVYYKDHALRKKDGEVNKVNFSNYTSEIMAEEIYKLLN